MILTSRLFQIKLKIWARNSVYDPKHAAVHKPLIKKWGRPYVPAPLSFLAKDIAFIPNAPMPAIYNTCATARSVLVKAFSSTLTFPDGTSIPFEPELDTVLIYNDSRRYNLKPLPCVPDNPATHPNYAEIFKEVKTVAVAHGAYLDNPDCPTSWFLKQFKSLKTLLLYKGLRMRF